MTLIEIIKDYLDKNGFDGLVNTEIECGCTNDDLIPCDLLFNTGCKPGYLHNDGDIYENKESEE